MGANQRRCSKSLRRTRRRGIALRDVIAAMLAVGLLLSIAVPGCTQSRLRAPRADCESRMRQVAMAVASYSFQNSDQIPVGVYKGSRYTAQSLILPFLEATMIYKRFNDFGTSADKCSDATKNRLPIYICPSDNPSGTYASAGGGTYARSNIVFSFGSDTMEPVKPAMAGALLFNAPSSFANMALDSTERTALASEVISGQAAGDPSGAWGYGEAGSCGYTHRDLPANTPLRPTLAASATNFSVATARASSLHPGVVNVVFGDNHVASIATSIDLAVWQAMGTANGGETMAFP